MSQIIVPVTKNQDPNLQCEWDIPLIQLHNDNDEVIWQLDELNQQYPGGKFWIKFNNPLNGSPKGPFFNLIDLKPADILHAMGRVHDWGTYIYDIWVVYDGERFRLTTPIDPQVDNIMPPPSAPFMNRLRRLWRATLAMLRRRS